MARKYNKALLGLSIIALGLLPSCKKSDAVTLPSYSNITISPQKDVYKLGDTIRCSIQLLDAGSTDLQKTQYWFYANWWFTDPEMTADFQEFVPDVQTGVLTATSKEIVLTEAAAQKSVENGHADLCFYGRLEYPDWDFRKIEIRVPISVMR